MDLTNRGRRGNDFEVGVWLGGGGRRSRLMYSTDAKDRILRDERGFPWSRGRSYISINYRS